jgi:signal transduction histidine kinase/CheY-like chemotaxis protein
MLASIWFYDVSLTSNEDREALERQDTNMNVAWHILLEYGDTSRVIENKLYFGNRVLNGDFATVDLIKRLVGGTATVFEGDQRVATNVRRSDGSRAVGTHLARGPVYDAVFGRGTAYRGKANILGVPFYTAYDPIKDPSGKVIGVLYVGIPQAEFLKPIQSIERSALLIGVALTAVFGLLSVLMCRWIFGPLVAVQAALERTMRGDLAVPVAGTEREDDIGQLARAVVALREVTKERLLASAVAEEERRKAEAANRSKTEFLAIMSHEIRTPLNGVLGVAQVMARDPLSRLQRDRLELISRSGESLLAILNDILDLSKIEAGKLELEEGEFDLEELALGAQGAFTTAANAKGLSFSLTVAESARGVYRGDTVRLRQIIYNLISNAVKFTSAGSIRVDIDRHPEGLRIGVRDTGVGIAPDRIERVFEKFVQADSSTTRKFGGTGLGLSICAELSRAMGGRIDVSSTPDEGSEFAVWLPLPRVGEPAERRGEADAADLPPAVEQLDDVRVLAAEDNQMNQLVLKTILAQVGAIPVIVGDGSAAVAAWADGDWDLILMDVQMPVMDGPTAARAIRAREAETGRARTPIIALTANAMNHQVAEYLAAGMDGFVAKPINIAELLTAVSAAIEERRRRSDASDPAAMTG